MKNKFYFIFCSPSAFLITLFLLSIHAASAQTDTAFWFAAPEVSIARSYQPCDRPIVFRLITSNQPAQVTISQPAGGGVPIRNINIPANTVRTIDLTTWLDVIESKPPNTALNYGLKITSDVPIEAYYQVVSGGTTNFLPDPEVFTLKGQNAFSPNGDGLNDVFNRADGFLCPIDDYKLKIYNRYGQLIFTSTNQDFGWDGYSNHKKADLGTYMFYLTFKEKINGKARIMKGDLTLIR